MEPLLSISGLTKSFGGVNATIDVNLEVTKNEVHAIIGPNGAGKTTLISQLSGTLKPDAGKIAFEGRDITATPAYRRAGLGITRSFQITSLLSAMSVIENVTLAVQARNSHSFRFIRAAHKIAHLRDEAILALEKVGLAHRQNDNTAELSHGEHRQVEIALALATNARLMLLDEPMAGLGPTESEKMIAILRELKATHTVLLIEHDMDAVFALADRISVLVYGKIIATGTPDEIRSNVAVRHAYLGEE